MLYYPPSRIQYIKKERKEQNGWNARKDKKKWLSGGVFAKFSLIDLIHLPKLGNK